MSNPNLKKFKYTPILGWSTSRYEIFQQCKRRYYYNYYPKFDPDYDYEKINFLKNLTTIPLEIGNIVHDIHKALLERLQKTAKPIDKTRFENYCYQLTENYCQTKTFAEVYYQIRSEIDIEELYQQVQSCVDNFLGSERFYWLMQKAIPNRAQWLIEPPGFGETRIGELKAYCKVDFLFPIDEHLYIIDWKTGKPNEEKHEKQMIGYATWAAYHFKKRAADIIPIISYLSPQYEEIKMAVDAESIAKFAVQVKTETEEMYQFCQNVTENIPKPKNTFPKTENTALCTYCHFRDLCF